MRQAQPSPQCVRKSFLWNVLSIIQPGSFKYIYIYNSQKFSSSPYSADDCGGVAVEVDVHTQVSPNSSDTDSRPSGAFTSDSLELRVSKSFGLLCSPSY